VAGRDEGMTLRRVPAWCAMASLAVVALAACAGETAAQACARGPIFGAARTRAERSVAELDTTSTIELEESLNALIDQLLVLRDVSPSELRDPLGTLLAAYGQLVVALDDVAWNPQAAAADSAVATARAAFAETSVSDATNEVEAFFDDQCKIAVGESDPLFAAVGSTLPLPEVSEEPSRDAAEDDAPSSRELASIGFLIGEAYGVALVAPEAECIASRLGVTFADASDINFDDEQFFALVRDSFVACAVTTPPTTAPDN
jgi:hypothetical protein